MKIIKNHCIEGSAGKPILLDMYWQGEAVKKKTVIFCHGYKGFKDWGAWELVAKEFAKAGFVFIKFNFSHNGGTVENPIDFPDLEAFGRNTYTIERNDLEKVIDWVTTTKILPKSKSLNLSVIGHSRGGGIALLQAGKDERISKIITWAAISDIGSRFPKGDELEAWKNQGIRYVKNGRTMQEMPHRYHFYEDYLQNKKALDILMATVNLKLRPLLIIHGNRDQAVNIEEAKILHQSNPKSTLKIIEETGHTFDSKHPWVKNKLPEKLQEVVDYSIQFCLE